VCSVLTVVGRLLTVVVLVGLCGPCHALSMSRARRQAIGSALGRPEALNELDNVLRTMREPSSMMLSPPISFDPNLPRVLIATPLKNAAKELSAYFRLINKLSYPRKKLSFTFLESDSIDATDAIMKNWLLYARGMFGNVVYKRSPANYSVLSNIDRHNHEVQAKRRTVLAAARNELLSISNLTAVDWVLWLDADVSDAPATLILDLLAVNRSVVAPHVCGGDGGSYDRNSWLETLPDEVWGPHANPKLADEPMFEGYGNDGPGARLWMDTLEEITHDQKQIVPLHGVGTAVLLVAAEVHRSGVNFPTTPYKRRLESEGFGLLANDAGFEVVGLPQYKVTHVNSADGETWWGAPPSKWRARSTVNHGFKAPLGGRKQRQQLEEQQQQQQRVVGSRHHGSGAGGGAKTARAGGDVESAGTNKDAQADPRSVARKAPGTQWSRRSWRRRANSVAEATVDAGDGGSRVVE